MAKEMAMMKRLLEEAGIKPPAHAETGVEVEVEVEVEKKKEKESKKASFWFSGWKS